ncbi:MAG: permease-like cell division protein FtsX [Thermodesulfobacteriota bacterium]
MSKTLRFLAALLTQTKRNLRKTWGTQLMMLVTVSLSVLIFSFFFLIYANMRDAGSRFDEIRLIVFFDEVPTPVAVEQLKDRIRAHAAVRGISYLPPEEGWRRLAEQLESEKDLLADLGPEFLPAALEITPGPGLVDLASIERLSTFLASLPGVDKVQYGQEWLRRFSSFMQLLRFITLLSGVLLILTTTFMVAYTIRLTVFTRKEELEVLRLLGASNNYIRIPLLCEGLLHGMLGSGLGLSALYFLFLWVSRQFAGQEGLLSFTLRFFPLPLLLCIGAASVALCTGGGLLAIRKHLRI